MSVQQKINTFNLGVNQWFSKILSKLKGEFSKQDIRHRKNSTSLSPAIDMMEQKTHKKEGIVNKGSIKFPQHMVYVHKGVGNHVPASLAGTAAAGNRKPKDWFNQVIDANIDDLANVLAENSADIAVEKFYIK